MTHTLVNFSLQSESELANWWKRKLMMYWDGLNSFSASVSFLQTLIQDVHLKHPLAASGRTKVSEEAQRSQWRGFKLQATFTNEFRTSYTFQKRQKYRKVTAGVLRTAGQGGPRRASLHWQYVKLMGFFQKPMSYWWAFFKNPWAISRKLSLRKSPLHLLTCKWNAEIQVTGYFQRSLNKQRRCRAMFIAQPFFWPLA